MFKYSVISLFVVAILTQSGFLAMRSVLSVVIHKQEMKARMKSLLIQNDNSESIEIFSEKDLCLAEWEHDEEFYLGNDKYDVLKVEKKDGILYYYCLNDNRESELIQALDKKSKHDKALEDVLKKSIMFIGSGQTSISHRICISECYTRLNFLYLSNYHLERFRPPIA